MLAKMKSDQAHRNANRDTVRIAFRLSGMTIDQTLVRRRVHDHNAGVQFRASRSDYVRVVKDLLDRRRKAQEFPTVT